MRYDILILAGAVCNLAVGIAILYFITKNTAVIKEFSRERYNNIDRYFNDLLERIQRIEWNNPVQVSANYEMSKPAQPDPGINRINSVIQKIQNGMDPDEIRKENGYSKSEMGLILATAGLTGINSGTT